MKPLLLFLLLIMAVSCHESARVVEQQSPQIQVDTFRVYKICRVKDGQPFYEIYKTRDKYNVNDYIEVGF